MIKNLVTAEKAEIIGLLCAEGSHIKYISDYIEFHKKRRKFYHRIKKSERIEFTNTNKRLLQHFQNLLKSVYNYSLKIICNKVRISKKVVIQDLLKYTDFGSEKWKVPKEILYGNKAVKLSFIRGYFYGDGCYSNTKKGPIIKLCSINKQGLRQVSNILNDIEVQYKFYSYKPLRPRKKVYQIMIRKRETIKRFHRLIINAGIAKTEL